MMVVSLETGPTFKAATPRMLFERSGYRSASRTYDVAPDGQRFLMVKQPAEETATPPQIVVVKHWVRGAEAAGADELIVRVSGVRVVRFVRVVSIEKLRVSAIE